MNDNLKDAWKRQVEALAGSAIYLGLFTENFANDPTCLAQLGLAIMMDKPIFLLIEESIMPGSSKLFKICDAWEHFKRNDPNSIHTSMDRLINKAKEMGKWEEKP